MTDFVRNTIEADGEFPKVFDAPELSDGAGHAVIFSQDGADWVDTPSELGKGRCYILQRGVSDCPKCAGECQILVLEKELAVYNCGECKQFFWVNWPKEGDTP